MRSHDRNFSSSPSSFPVAAEHFIVSEMFRPFLIAKGYSRDGLVVGENSAAFLQNFWHFREISLGTIHCGERQVHSRSGIRIVALNELKMLLRLLKTTARTSTLAQLEVIHVAVRILI